MIRPVKTAILPAGGYGTRFLPITKSIPKEMLPLGNKPVILHVVEEAVKAGIENIIFVVSYHKNAVEQLFAPNEALEDYYQKMHKSEAVKQLRQISKLAHYTFIYTEWPYGNGGALLSARHLLDDEPFLLAWTDEVILSKGKSRIQQCLDTYQTFGLPVVSMIEVANPEQRQEYGMAELIDFTSDKNIKQIKHIVEKPAKGKEPSAYAAHGAYVLDSRIFEVLDELDLKPEQELWLTDLLNQLAKKSTVLGRLINDGAYMDCGNPLQYIYSQINYALEFSPYREEVQAFIRQKIGCDVKQRLEFQSVFSGQTIDGHAKPKTKTVKPTKLS